LQDEEFGALDFEPVLFPWYADDTVAAAARLAGGPLGSDAPGASTPGPGLTPVNLYPLRAALSETEIARFRWLGAETADATVEALHQVEPGLSEYDLEAMTAAGLLRRGIQPSVYLYAVDERILQYKHAVVRGKRLKPVRHAESVRAQMGLGHIHHAVRSLWRAAEGTCIAL